MQISLIAVWGAGQADRWRGAVVGEPAPCPRPAHNGVGLLHLSLVQLMSNGNFIKRLLNQVIKGGSNFFSLPFVKLQRGRCRLDALSGSKFAVVQIIVEFVRDFYCS